MFVVATPFLCGRVTVSGGNSDVVVPSDLLEVTRCGEMVQ